MASTRTWVSASPAAPARTLDVDRRRTSEAARSVHRFGVMAASFRRLLGDPGELGALNPHPGHEPLLAEDEGIDILGQRGRGRGFSHAFIDDDDARPDP